MSLLQRIKSLLPRPMAAVPLLAATSPAFADGFAKANDVMAKFASGLHGLAAITVTVAVMWVGYKVLWNGKSLQDCGNIIIGAILIVSAAELAALSIS
ncbi:TPA: TrbC/VirB2 family protein [Yersinia enterocolitica]